MWVISLCLRDCHFPFIISPLSSLPKFKIKHFRSYRKFQNKSPQQNTSQSMQTHAVFAENKSVTQAINSIWSLLSFLTMHCLKCCLLLQFCTDGNKLAAQTNYQWLWWQTLNTWDSQLEMKKLLGWEPKCLQISTTKSSCRWFLDGLLLLKWSLFSY